MMLDRRRFLTVVASGLLAQGLDSATAYAGGAPTVWWRGAALGAEATIRLVGAGRARAGETIGAIEAELARLEDIFSLYRTDSAISRLNREGVLVAPPVELIEVLGDCDSVHKATGGAFDPTIQPLWLALAHAGDGGRGEPSIRRDDVGWRHVQVAPDRVAFDRPGMAITLNGVAQGYITDRIAGLLRARGYGDVLVDMGEICAMGDQYGQGWQAGIAAPDGHVVHRVTLRDRCLATSSPMGTVLDAARGVGHIIDPRPGRGRPTRRLVSVSATRASIADALSTGCCLLSATEAAAAAARCRGARIETLI